MGIESTRCMGCGNGYQSRVTYKRACQFWKPMQLSLCKTLVAQKNAWDYVMEAWGSLVNCPCESSFDEYVKKIEMDCSSWPIFVDYVCQTWVIPHKEKFVKAWTDKVMHLGNTTTKRFEYCFFVCVDNFFGMLRFDWGKTMKILGHLCSQSIW